MGGGVRVSPDGGKRTGDHFGVSGGGGREQGNGEGVVVFWEGGGGHGWSVWGLGKWGGGEDFTQPRILTLYLELHANVVLVLISRAGCQLMFRPLFT